MIRYKDVYPELPQTIVQMALDEQRNRNEYNRKLLAKKTLLTFCGMFSALCSIAIIMSASVLCAYLNHPLMGGVIGSGGIVIIVSTFVYSGRVLSHSKQSRK